MTDTLPLLLELWLVIAGRLKPERDATFFLATMRKLFDFRRQQNKCRWRRRNHFVHDDPEVPHDFFKRAAKRNRMAFAQCFDLNCNLPGGVLAVGDDVNTTSVSCRGHDVPATERKLIAAIVEAGISGELRIKRHIERPNVK